VHGEHVVTKLSPWSVADTIARLLAVAAARELKVFAIIDHSGEAANVGCTCATPSWSSLEALRRERH
jgi:uncharacterized protein (DUF302 family)